MINVLVIEGNLGQAPEARHSTKGDIFVTGSIAVTLGWGDNKKTMWLKYKCFTKHSVGFLQKLNKGTPVVFSGRLEEEQWEKDGVKRTAPVINVENVKAMSRGGTSDGSSQDDGPGPEPAPRAARSNVNSDDDVDLPI